MKHGPNKDIQSAFRSVYSTVQGRKVIDHICEVVCGERVMPSTESSLKMAADVGRQSVAVVIRDLCDGAGVTAKIRGKTVRIVNEP
jgi:hypothetical protein